MGNAFGKKKTLKEQMRENKRTMNRAIRELDRERVSLQNQEKKLVIEIKKMAKEGQMSSVKIMAKDLVQIRNHVTKFYTMRSQLQAVSLKLETAKSTEAMTSALAGTSKSMQSIAKQMNLPKLNQIMVEFTKESDKLDMTNEMVGDSIDMVMEEDLDEEEQDRIVGQVLDEIGIDLTGQVPEAPMQHLAQASAVAKPMVAPAAPTAIGGPSSHNESKNDHKNNQGGGGGLPDMPTASSSSAQESAVNELEARLNNLRRS